MYNQTMNFASRMLNALSIFIVVLFMLPAAAVLPEEGIERVHAYTRENEFDYLEWMLDALFLKSAQDGLSVARYLDPEEQKRVVYETLDLVAEVNRISHEINKVYADPAVQDPAEATADLRARRDNLDDRRSRMAVLAEGVIQAQVTEVTGDLDLTFLGQPVPPVLYHITPLPYGLIISPRDRIEQEANISLLPGMTLEERIRIEEEVARNLDKSTLVVGIGGVGVYPTMVMSTTDLNWLVEVVAHEWIHNFLTLRPLGALYDSSPQMRTINETTASLAGKEIGREVVRRYYPERIPPEEAPAPDPTPQPAPDPDQPPPFDFRKEMRDTRIRVDELLAEGRIDEAEAYMEERRRFLWENGYLIRKLNQAYFAFYGAYNDAPGGSAEAGKDPVGPAVVELRRRSVSLAQFLNQISWVTSFEGLQKLTGD
jgi:hypothetical protein